mgnify:CR=1 FL=1
MESDEFFTIKEYPFYSISKNGKVWSTKSTKFLNIRVINGYKTVRFGKKTEMIHRLIATTFIDNPFNRNVVNHINEDKLDNSLENLEWCTQKENVNRHSKDTSHPRAVLQICPKTGIIINEYDTITNAAKTIGVDRRSINLVCTNVNRTCKGYFWKYKDKDYERVYCDISKGQSIDNYENYVVFESGDVYSKKRKSFMKPCKNASGNLYITLLNESGKKNFYISRLVASAFINNIENKNVIHINKDKNDNRVENLKIK